MGENHVDDVSKKKQQMQSIFTSFSNLFSEKGRSGKEFLSLINCLSDSDLTVGSQSNLKYSIKRFIRGLSSAHLYPQCASFAGLACFLKFELTTAEEILDVLESESKGDLTKSEQGALKSGCVLTCGAIIQSGIFNNLSSETKETILNKLFTVGKSKSYLSAATTKFLVDIVSMVDENDFRNVIWPVCKREMKSTLNSSDVNNYDFLLACHNRFPKIVDKFIIKEENTFESFVEKIVMFLVNNYVKHDEPIYERVCQAMITNKKLLLKLWADSVNIASTCKSSFKDKTIITLFYNIMKNLNEEKIVPKLLLPKFIEMLILILSFRKTKKFDDSNCNALAKSSIDYLVSYLTKENVSNSVRFKTIEKLMFYPANMKFEKKTGTKCIQLLIMQLDDASLKQLAEIHRNIVSGNLKKIVDEEENSEDWNNNEKQYVLHIFVKFLNHPSVKKEKEWRLEQIKFLFDSGFIRNPRIHSSVQKCARDCFYKAIEIQMPNLEDILELLDELVLHVNDKLENEMVELPENARESWDKVVSTIKKLKKSQDRLFVAIHLLLIHMGLQLFSDTNLAIFNIDELLQCYSRLQTKQKKRKDDDLNWSEVTVDLMLSLLSRENKLWRYVVCNLVFPQMVKHITPSALHQIIDVLNPQSGDRVLNDQSGGSEEEEDEGEEEEAEDNEEDGDGDDDEEEDEEKEDGKSESSLTESENDENVTLNDQLRLAVKDALGMSAALTDQESVDMDDMDEEEERKLNERLSAAFKMFKSTPGRVNKKQTKEEKALMHFRFRVLDLVEIYVTNGPSVLGCLDLLHPLFNLLELSVKDANQRVFYHRVDSILKKLASLKKFPDVESINEKTILDHFQVLLSRKELPSMIFVEMSQRISECSAFLVRCSQMIPDAGSEVPLASNYKSLMENFFHSRDNKLQITLFQSVLRSVWKGNWELVPTLFDLLVDPTIKLFKKMKVIELLDIFYKNSKLHASGEEETKSDLNEVENKFIKKFIDYLSDYQGKKVKTNEKMFLAFFTKVLSLVAVANQSFKRHRSETKKPPLWRELIAKMVEIEIVSGNKKSRRIASNLANLFDVKIPEVPEARAEAPAAEESMEDEEDTEETHKKKRKSKGLSSEKVKMKKESGKLREAAGNEGIDFVPFSSLDVYSIPEDVEPEPPEPKTKKRKAKMEGANGSPSKRPRYANEVGEAFRSIVPKFLVHASYGIASLYVLADTYDKTVKAEKKERQSKNYDVKNVAKIAVDTLSWQALASVIIPGFVINRLCALSFFALSKTKLSCNAAKWTTTAIGLSSIPFIVTPIDTSVDYAFDKTLRPLLGIPPKHSD